jgi:hypothetical protein
MREARCRESERRELSWFFLSLFFPFFVYGPCFFGLANRDTRQGVGQSEDRSGGGGSAGENQRACMMSHTVLKAKLNASITRAPGSSYTRLDIMNTKNSATRIKSYYKP